MHATETAANVPHHTVHLHDGRVSGAFREHSPSEHPQGNRGIERELIRAPDCVSSQNSRNTFCVRSPIYSHTSFDPMCEQNISYVDVVAYIDVNEL